MTVIRKTLAAAMLAAAFTGVPAMSQTAPETLTLTQEWDKIFPKSDKVEHRKITFTNRYGITLVGDLYVPKNAPKTDSGKLPAIAVAGPFGAVKEQASGLYAQTLAERGFVTLAFDASYTGESGGNPRHLASPEINSEDFSAAIDVLGRLDNVERERIGILGICGFGGFALNAAVADTRVKAVAVSTMYDMTRVMAEGYNGSVDTEARYAMKEALNQARWDDHAQGSPPLPEADSVNADTPKFLADYVDFYKPPRGFHARSVGSNGAWTAATPLAFINMPILQRASELRAPALVVHGENAHSRYFSEDAFNTLGSKDKELFIVEGASHVDLYDNRAGKIPYDKFAQFFKANLQ